MGYSTPLSRSERCPEPPYFSIGGISTGTTPLRWGIYCNGREGDPGLEMSQEFDHREVRFCEGGGPVT